MIRKILIFSIVIFVLFLIFSAKKNNSENKNLDEQIKTSLETIKDNLISDNTEYSKEEKLNLNQGDILENDSQKINITNEEIPNDNSDAEELNNNAVNLTPSDFSSIYDDDIILGNKNAKVVVIEYFSMTCPHCKDFYFKEFPKIKKEFIDTNKIAFIKREIVANKQDFEATTLARCNDENRLKFYELLLKQQDSWAFNRNFHDMLTNIGQVAGIQPDKFLGCLENKALVEIYLRNLKEASSSPKFIGTPFFLINGVPYEGSFEFFTFSKAINNEIERVSKLLTEN